MKKSWVQSFASKIKALIILLCIIAISSCAPTRFVETLDEGQSAVSFNLGGPTINYAGAVIPVPLSSLCYGYGIDTNITVFGGLHTTSALFKNLQFDLGGVFKVHNQQGYIPAVSVSPAINFVADMNDPVYRIWPQADLNIFWNHGKRNNCFYAGVQNWFEVTGKRAHEQENLTRWLCNPQLGYIIKTKSIHYGIELKWLAPTHDNTNAFVPYQGITGSKGATGLYIYLTKPF